MEKPAEFSAVIEEGYKFKGDSVLLGAAMLDGNPVKGLQVKAPLKMFNRHGLISGATGTGKTKTLQGIAEGLSNAGVPVLLMDIKGDLSGLAAEGNPHPKIDERHNAINSPWVAKAFPVELLTISDEKGVRMRATISEFGPVLLSKILGLNDTQQGIVAMAFKYCDDKQLPLLDIKDFRKVLQYISQEGKKEVEESYGLVSTSSVGAIMRKLLELEQQGAEKFFGEMSTDVDDLLRLDDNGNGVINVLRLTDMQSKPKLFSTFMLCLMAEIYEKFPERGDSDRPELVIFIDEAHLIFDEASKALLDQIETIVKLIRSKGVGIFFCTQLPTDVPDAILSQLGMKVQHALRAFTAKDRKSIKQVAENYPISEFYETDQVLTSMGIGEALVSLLNEKGIPTPLAHVLLKAPQSRMDILTDDEIGRVLKMSQLSVKYDQAIDRESAYEMLTQKLELAAKEQAEADKEAEEEAPSRRSSGRREPSTFETIMKSPATRTIVQEVTRGILGVLGISTTRRRSSSRRRR
jgi:DNA helicase HerA-like ATPase